MVVGFAAGGGNDIFARLIQNELQKRTGWTVVVENKPGAGGRLAAEYRRARAGRWLHGAGRRERGDGDRPLIYKTAYDTLKSFIAGHHDRRFSAVPRGLGRPSGQDGKGMWSHWTKANPGQGELRDLVAGFHVAVELFKMKSGANGTAIPYKSFGRIDPGGDFGQMRR